MTAIQTTDLAKVAAASAGPVNPPAAAANTVSATAGESGAAAQAGQTATESLTSSTSSTVGLGMPNSTVTVASPNLVGEKLAAIPAPEKAKVDQLLDVAATGFVSNFMTLVREGIQQLPLRENFVKSVTECFTKFITDAMAAASNVTGDKPAVSALSNSVVLNELRGKLQKQFAPVFDKVYDLLPTLHNFKNAIKERSLTAIFKSFQSFLGNIIGLKGAMSSFDSPTTPTQAAGVPAATVVPTTASNPSGVSPVAPVANTTSVASGGPEVPVASAPTAVGQVGTTPATPAASASSAAPNVTAAETPPVAEGSKPSLWNQIKSGLTSLFTGGAGEENRRQKLLPVQQSLSESTQTPAAVPA